MDARRIPSDSPDALALVAAMFAEIAALYTFGDDPGPSATPEDFAPPGGGFVAIYDDGRPVAGGGIKRLGEGLGEIKRMYVVPDARGRGLARVLLEALEELAHDLGYERVRLDTGVHQHAALKLYRGAGYLEIDDYNDNPYASYWERSASDPRISGLILVGAMVAVMWLVEVINAVDHYSLDRFGIRPRQGDGLDGIVFSPFLHASWGHLIGNTIPFVVLGGLIALSGLARVAAVTALVAGIGGAGVWLFAPSNSLHIGASGVVFGYAGYLVARGLFTRSMLHIGVGVVVAAIWGTTLISGLVPQDGISWQGHLFGGIGGIVAARLLTATRAEKPAAAVRPDPFAI